jgi:hypothetical protein
MKKNILILFTLLFIIPFAYLIAQSGPRITNTEIKLAGSQLLIGYTIEENNKKDLFTVWVEITDSASKPLEAKSLTGDLGAKIKGGRNKQIIWDLAKDSILLSENIFIEVKAEKEILPEIQPQQKSGSEITDNSEPITVGEVSKNKSYSAYGLLLRSVAYPGWGTSLISDRRAYLVMGAAGYGFLAGSVIYNRLAVTAYEDYLGNTEADNEQNTQLFNHSVELANVSRTLAYTGLAIWVTDMVLVSVKTYNKNKKLAKGLDRIELNSCYSMQDKCPMFGLTYRF